MGAGFVSSHAAKLRQQYAEAQSALSGTRQRIERARRARGVLPSFLEGAIEALPRDPKSRVSGYEG